MKSKLNYSGKHKHYFIHQNFQHSSIHKQGNQNSEMIDIIEPNKF
jgi:hypothetical protein